MDRAVVIGAGIAGIAVARTLADRFAEVLLLDRDELPDAARPRRGVPQGHHPHVLLVAGQRAAEALFPGLHADLVAAGATPFDPGSDLMFCRYGDVWPPIATGVENTAMSRPLFEWTMYRRVAALPNVTVRDQVAVSGLTGDQDRVTGVRLDDGGTLAADLVVDCSGRGGRSDRWLSALGAEAPASNEVKVDVGYATKLLRRRPGQLPGVVGAFVLPTPPDERRVGLALPIEGDRWIVGLGGWHGAYPETSEGAYRSHADALPHSTIAELLAEAEPLSDVVGMRFPASRRRRFEELRRVPAGYLSAGDAFCSVNPVYGQGMTCAVLQASAVGDVLDRYGGPTAHAARAFYRQAARIVRTPWQFATGGDFVYAETRGARPLGIGVLNRYSRRIQLAARVSPEVRRVFVAVQQLVEPPSALWRPSFVAKVLKFS